MGVDRTLDGERAAPASQLRIAPRRVLRTTEVRQQVLEAPADGPVGGPAVVAGAIASQVHHRVDTTATAQHLAARIRQDSSIESGLGGCVKTPVDVAAQKCEPLRRRIHRVDGVPSTGFDEQDPDLGIFANPSSHNATRGPAPHDDVVI